MTGLRKPQGFTLIEVAAVLAIIAVVTGVSILAISRIKRRGDFVSATGDFIVALRQTRAQAYGRGSTTVFVVDSGGGRYWGIEYLAAGNFSLTTFDPTNPAPSPNNLLTSGTLPASTTFGPAAGYGAALPDPYGAIPVNAACTFCLTSGTNSGFGSITFQTMGGASFSNPGAGAAPVAGSVTLNSPAATAANQMTVAIVGRTGAAETFEAFR